MTPDDILQALKNQRFWPNPDTLDEDLQNAITLIQQLCETNAKYIANMMEVMVFPYCRAHDYPLDGGSMDALPASIHRKMT